MFAGLNILVAQPASSRAQHTTNTLIAAEFIVELKRGGTGILVERIDTSDQVFRITLHPIDIWPKESKEWPAKSTWKSWQLIK
jgi:hypothetical protein